MKSKSLRLLFVISIILYFGLSVPIPKVHCQGSPNEGSLPPWIPTGYDTYTLIIFSGHEWEKQNRQDEVKEIYIDFLNFSDSIGENNLGVWFWKNKREFQVDVKKGQDFCAELDLNPNQGPYVIVTSFYPILEEDLDLLESQVQSMLDHHYLRYNKGLESSLKLELESINKRLKNREFQVSEVGSQVLTGIYKILKEEPPILWERVKETKELSRKLAPEEQREFSNLLISL